MIYVSMKLCYIGQCSWVTSLFRFSASELCAISSILVSFKSLYLSLLLQYYVHFLDWYRFCSYLTSSRSYAISAHVVVRVDSLMFKQLIILNLRHVKESWACNSAQSILREDRSNLTNLFCSRSKSQLWWGAHTTEKYTVSLERSSMKSFSYRPADPTKREKENSTVKKKLQSPLRSRLLKVVEDRSDEGHLLTHSNVQLNISGTPFWVCHLIKLNL